MDEPNIRIHEKKSLGISFFLPTISCPVLQRDGDWEPFPEAVIKQTEENK